MGVSAPVTAGGAALSRFVTIRLTARAILERSAGALSGADSPATHSCWSDCLVLLRGCGSRSIRVVDGAAWVSAALFWRGGSVIFGAGVAAAAFSRR
jgi:hypothetical protein